MAFIIEKESECCLCGFPLDSEKEFLLIPPLISNTRDPLYKFSDNGVHSECLNKSQLKDRLLKHISIYDKRIPPSKLKCIVDGRNISSPEKLISIGLLTSNKNDELYKFNYIDLNKDNLCRWNLREYFIEVGRKYLKENKWISSNEFNYLAYIINEVRN